ncbi:DEAD/DEAH box helicase family protein [Streptomyces sp. CBMA156]|uniref:DEAD/DEAH box helicase family protein n=1 Tax=Streptomyces sp. CBMA156 TaxID=1930280 RepID=UPI001661A890|nr:DEAD/DEAH box helicase family protein [Streptomyces sp. CBMA156]MBD0676984.1 DNA repair helicase [Streptomyces sp. CBMA156]
MDPITRLRDTGLGPEYRSDRGHIVQDFYLPALRVATRYDRAVGYFTSSSLALLGQGLDDFAARGGVMRIIASPYLELQDVADIEAGYALRDVLERAALRDLCQAIEEPCAARGLGKLGQLVATGRVEFKLAYVSSGNRVGMYHEKIGVFRDDRDLIAFKGSANETRSGLVGNFESIEVFRSWDPRDADRALRISQDFDNLWQDRTQLLRVLPFTEAAKQIVEQAARSTANRSDLDELPSDGAPMSVDQSAGAHRILTIPRDLRIRDYQREAVQNWFARRGRGMFRMATGTGKTVTALAAAAQLSAMLLKRNNPLLTVIVVPYQHLVDQWADDVARFGVTAVRAYESTSVWNQRAADLRHGLALGVTQAGVVITTNKTFGEEPFQHFLSGYRGQLLFIADEAHNLGAARLRTRLPPNAQYRLGLSATPERWFDDAGTDALTDYFGDIAFEMGIGEAIQLGALCRYTYWPVLVELDDEEAELYVTVTSKIAKLMASRQGNDPLDDDSPLGALLRKRANILGHARTKLPALKQELQRRREQGHQLIYCAEGRHPLSYENGTAEPTQLDQVMMMTGTDLHMPVARYTSETGRADRQDVLRRFSDGANLQAIASMRCLDEGVDVPAARTAYLLASSSNPRQFIQRRGRVLRKADGKDTAEIIDFIVVPPEGASALQYEAERRMLRGEFARVEEFARLAENEAHTLDLLRPLRTRYGLFDT